MKVDIKRKDIKNYIYNSGILKSLYKQNNQLGTENIDGESSPTKSNPMISKKSLANSNSTVKGNFIEDRCLLILDANLADFLENTNLSKGGAKRQSVRFFNRNRKNLLINTSFNALRLTQNSAELK